MAPAMARTRLSTGSPSRANLRLIVLPRGGKAAALNAGIARATGEILFFTDVRQELAPDCLANLVECFADPKVGRRFAANWSFARAPETKRPASASTGSMRSGFASSRPRIDSVMGATGCIYAMRRELASRCREAPWWTICFCRWAHFFSGYRVILDDTAIAYDYPTQLASEFRRKVRTLAGVYQVIGQYPALLAPRNRMWIHFMSHKLARLLMPWAHARRLSHFVWAGSSLERLRARGAGRGLWPGGGGFPIPGRRRAEKVDVAGAGVHGVDGGLLVRHVDLFPAGGHAVGGDPRQFRGRQRC